MVVGTSPVMDHSGGVARRGGGALRATRHNAERWRRRPTNAHMSIRGALGTHRDDPELRRLPETCRRRRTAAVEELPRGELHQRKERAKRLIRKLKDGA